MVEHRFKPSDGLATHGAQARSAPEDQVTATNRTHENAGHWLRRAKRLVSLLKCLHNYWCVVGGAPHQLVTGSQVSFFQTPQHGG